MLEWFIQAEHTWTAINKHSLQNKACYETELRNDFFAFKISAAQIRLSLKTFV